MNQSLDRGGLLAAASAFVLWGLFPLYWVLLKTLPAIQIVGHRVVWCALFVGVWLHHREGIGWLRRSLVDPRTLPILLASSVLISINWGIYIWAVLSGRVVEASLGYFINPLVNVLIGVMLLGERLNRAQTLAVAIAAVGVLWLTLRLGTPPWVALTLALSFGFYGYLRKKVAVDAVPGLAIESLLLSVPAIGYLLWAEIGGFGVFGQGGTGDRLLLAFGGALTAIPLIGFAYGARRIPYSLVGILQYLAPTLQLLIGVLLLGEPFTGDQAIGFGCIWLALVLYAGDGLRRSRKAGRAAAPPQST